MKAAKRDGGQEADKADKKGQEGSEGGSQGSPAADPAKAGALPVVGGFTSMAHLVQPMRWLCSKTARWLTGILNLTPCVCMER